MVGNYFSMDKVENKNDADNDDAIYYQNQN